MKLDKESIIEYLENTPNLSDRDFFTAVIALGDTDDKSAIPYLLNLWKNFDSLSWQRRNAIAMALGNLGADEAVPLLMKIVMDKSYWGCNGSILYAIAIKPLQSKEYFLDFIVLVCNDSIEIRISAYDLIEHYSLEVDDAIIIKSLEILEENKATIINENKPRQSDDKLSYINEVENDLRKLL